MIRWADRIKKISLIFFIATCAFNSAANAPQGQIIHQGHVGATEIKGTPYTPDAIVMKDAAGNDVLVVFYRHKGDAPIGGFAVARAAGDHGALVWDSEHYTINTSALRIEKFSPAPILLNDKLYVFGRQNKNHSSDGKRKLIYNSVQNNIEDLINNRWRSSTFLNHVQNGLATNPDQDRAQISLANYAHVQNGVTSERLLMAYHESSDAKQVKFSTSSCKPIEDSVIGTLFCEGGEVYADTQADFPHPPHLIKTTYSGNGISSIGLLTRQKDSLTLHGFNPNTLAWNHFHSSWLVFSDEPLGSAQIDDTLYLYFKSRDGVIIGETYAFTWDMTGPTAFTHFYPLLLRSSDYEYHRFYADEGVKAVVFNNRIYIFYVDKNTKVLRYLVRMEEYNIG